MVSNNGSLGPVSSLSHVVVYRDKKARYNGAFPQVAQLSDGRVIVAFRQAPFPPSGGTSTSKIALHNHGDVNSRAVIVRSSSNGSFWNPDTLQVLANPHEGIEQISVSAIKGDVLVSPYSERRALLEGEAVKVRRSCDSGVTWDQPTVMDTNPLMGARTHGPMLELSDNTLLSPHCGVVLDRSGMRRHAVTIVRSRDAGRTWGDTSEICRDILGNEGVASMAFHQASLLQMPDGEILAAMQSGGKRIEGQIRPMMHLWISRSFDLGYTWSSLERLPLRISGESRQRIVTGAAHHMLRLGDGRILITWGHRDDCTIRAAVSEDGGTTWDTSEGWVLRQGVDVRDIGEPCSVQFADGRVFTVYYWGNNANDPLLYIEGAVFEV